MIAFALIYIGRGFEDNQLYYLGSSDQVTADHKHFFRQAPTICRHIHSEKPSAVSAHQDGMAPKYNYTLRGAKKLSPTGDRCGYIFGRSALSQGKTAKWFSSA